MPFNWSLITTSRQQKSNFVDESLLPQLAFLFQPFPSLEKDMVPNSFNSLWSIDTVAFISSKVYDKDDNFLIFFGINLAFGHMLFMSTSDRRWQIYILTASGFLINVEGVWITSYCAHASELQLRRKTQKLPWLLLCQSISGTLESTWDPCQLYGQRHRAPSGCAAGCAPLESWCM